MHLLEPHFDSECMDPTDDATEERFSPHIFYAFEVRCVWPTLSLSIFLSSHYLVSPL